MVQSGDKALVDEKAKVRATPHLGSIRVDFAVRKKRIFALSSPSQQIIPRPIRTVMLHRNALLETQASWDKAVETRPNTLRNWQPATLLLGICDTKAGTERTA